MKKQFTSFASILLMSLLSLPFVLSFVSRNAESKLDNESKAKEKALLAWEAMKDRESKLMNYTTGKVEKEDLYRSMSEAYALRSSGSRGGVLNLFWESLGPDNVGGRTRAILVDKDNSNLIFAGGASGGLWMSTDQGNSWKLNESFKNATETVYNSIGSIAQAANGDLYVGTGEPWAYFTSSYMPGNGIYKSTDLGNTWTHLSATGITNDSVPEARGRWSVVNRIATDPQNSNHLYAALENGGLFESTDGGASWAKPSALSTSTTATDVRYHKDANVIYAVANTKQVYRSVDGGASWTNLTATTGLGTLLNAPSPGRVEIAIAPSDPNYVYLLCSNSCLQGVYRTTDGGTTWSTLLGRGSTLDPFAQPTGGAGCQGGYDDCIAVVPNDKTKIYIGGVTLYSFSDGLSWKRVDKLGTEGSDVDDPNFVHADKHFITFDPNNPEVMYVGHDGGVTRTINANTKFPNPDFKTVIKGYTTLQLYSMGAGLAGDVIGGAQDNGTNYIDYKGNTVYSAKDVMGGDGFFCEISHLNPSVMFGSVYFADLRRSGNKGSSFSTFYDSYIDPDGSGEPGSCTDCNPFITTFFLKETRSAFNTNRRAVYTNKTGSVITAGTEIQVTSNTSSVLFPFTLSADLAKDSSISVPDRIDAKLYLAVATAASPGFTVWVCINPLNISQQPKWFRIPLGNVVNSFAASKDGNVAYFGAGASLIRVSGLQTANFSTQPNITGLTIQSLSLPGSARTVDGIYVDDNDSNHVVVVRSGYQSGTASVLKSTDGITFTNITNNLPQMPVYDVVIDARDRDNYVIGTELGYWSSDNGGASWSEENDEMGWTPVYRLRQLPLYEDGCPVIYAGTHGRGFWRTTTLLDGTSCKLISGQAIPGVKGSNGALTLNVYPNPASESLNLQFDLENNENADIRIIDLPGKIVYTQHIQNGSNTISKSIDISSLPAGAYIVSVSTSNGNSRSKTFVKK